MADLFGYDEFESCFRAFLEIQIFGMKCKAHEAQDLVEHLRA